MSPRDDQPSLPFPPTGSSSDDRPSPSAPAAPNEGAAPAGERGVAPAGEGGVAPGGDAVPPAAEPFAAEEPAGEEPAGEGPAPRSLTDLRRRGVLTATEVHVTEALGRLTGEERDEVRLAIALTARAPRLGHVCLDLDRLAAHGVDAAGEEPVEVVLPEATAWRDALRASPAVRLSDDADAARGPAGAGPGERADEPTTPTAGAAPTPPLVLDGPRCYLDRYWRYEVRLAERLRRLAAHRPDDRDPTTVTAALDRLFPPVDDGPDLQRQAAETAAQRALTVLSGGPGTGKTTTVVRLLAVLLETADGPPPRIVLAAPTGKAAARMGEAVAEALAAPWLDLAEASRHVLRDVPTVTLHRLLGFRPDAPTRFRHHARRPLAHDVVVVDEASMMSLPMAAKLVDAVRDGARLVLVGDRDQLASVEAGAVLAEVCAPGARDGALDGSVVQLTRFHRFGPDSGIGAVARAVQRVDDDATEVLELLEGRRSEPGHDGAYSDIALHEPAVDDVLPPGLLDEVVAAYAEVVARARADAPPEEVLAALDRQQVLCALRSGPQGVVAANRRIGQGLAPHGYRPDERFPLGRPVMITQNDYAVRLFNGDVGVVVADPDDPARRVVAFPTAEGPPRLLGTGRLPPHETVWAMSVHKSQGSQFARVVVVLPTRPSPVLGRELVYTGVTRARRRVDVVARRELLGASLVRTLPRASGLAARLSR